MVTNDGEKLRLRGEVLRHFEAMAEDRTGLANSRFGAWVVESPDHVEAVLLCTAEFREIARLDAASTDRWVFALGPETPVESAPVQPVEEELTGFEWARALVRRYWLPVSAVAAGVIGAIGFWVALHHDVRTYNREGIYRLDARTTMQLGDGARAAVKTVRGGLGHEVTLLAGEGFFTGHDDAVHFLIVFFGNGVARPVGTEFDVLRQESGARVSVLGGVVKVSAFCSNGTTVSEGAPVNVAASESVVLESGDCRAPLRTSDLTEADTAATVEWKEWRRFRGMELSEAVRLFNEINGAVFRLVIQDAQLGNERIGGRFRITDPKAFVQTLVVEYHVHTKEARGRDGSTVVYLYREKES
jgi:ferric-dicitrate binding protein FerR (iron transport regulator)